MNAKIYNGNVQPNPKEFKIWVNDEGIIKTWNGTKWVENTAGGGGSDSGEASSIEYLDVSGSGMVTFMLSCSLEAKLSHNGGTNVMIAPSMTVYQTLVELGSDYDSLLVKIDINGATCIKNGSDVTTTTIGDLLTQVGIDVNSFPRITKEQFYSLE